MTGPPVFLVDNAEFDAWWVLGSGIFVCYSLFLYGYYSSDETDDIFRDKLKRSSLKSFLQFFTGLVFL